MASTFSSNLRGGRGRKFKSEINVVPYIDVMLVLLIIFMVVPPSNTPNEINLPTAAKSTLPPADYIHIVIKPNQAIGIGIIGSKRAPSETAPNRRVVLEKLRALHAAYPEYPVLISGDKNSKYDDVIQLVSEAKKMGIARVGLATK